MAVLCHVGIYQSTTGRLVLCGGGAPMKDWKHQMQCKGCGRSLSAWDSKRKHAGGNPHVGYCGMCARAMK